MKCKRCDKRLYGSIFRAGNNKYHIHCVVVMLSSEGLDFTFHDADKFNKLMLLFDLPSQFYFEGKSRAYKKKR